MKLLVRTISNYLLYSGLLVLLCTPLFYFVVEKLLVNKIDHELREHKADFIRSMSSIKSEADLKFYHLINEEFKLTPSTKIFQHDSLYTEFVYDSSEATEVPHRVLVSGITLNGNTYQLKINESLVSNSSLVAALMSAQVTLLLLLLGGTVIINRKLSKVIWGPFYKILDRLKQYQIDKDNVIELPHTSTAEFRELSHVITQLVHKNQQAYLNQKEFTENASHELQTPIAIFRSKLDLLAQTEGLTREQADIISTLFDTTDRISRLNRSLLLLARIEGGQYIEQELVSLREVVERSLHTFIRQASEKGIAVKSSLDNTPPMQANLTLVEALVNNIVSNAVRHTREKGEILVTLSGTLLDVRNTGTPLESPEKIFERFHRETSNTYGSGLGLAIATKICETTGYVMAYAYNGTHHCFSIQFEANHTRAAM